MLKEVLLEEEISLFNTKHTIALKNFSVVFNSESQKKQYKLLYPLKNAGFSFYEAKMFNFKAGLKIWTNCSNPYPRNQGGRPILNPIISENINKHMETLSEPAANRYLLKSKMNARYRLTTYKTAFNSFTKLSKAQFSLQTFRKKILKRFKKPHRLSDLCDLCEHGKVDHLKFHDVDNTIE